MKVLVFRDTPGGGFLEGAMTFVYISRDGRMSDYRMVCYQD